MSLSYCRSLLNIREKVGSIDYRLLCCQSNFRIPYWMFSESQIVISEEKWSSSLIFLISNSSSWNPKLISGIFSWMKSWNFQNYFSEGRDRRPIEPWYLFQTIKWLSWESMKFENLTIFGVLELFWTRWETLNAWKLECNLLNKMQNPTFTRSRRILNLSDSELKVNWTVES